LSKSSARTGGGGGKLLFGKEWGREQKRVGRLKGGGGTRAKASAKNIFWGAEWRKGKSGNPAKRTDIKQGGTSTKEKFLSGRFNSKNSSIVRPKKKERVMKKGPAARCSEWELRRFQSKSTK